MNIAPRTSDALRQAGGSAARAARALVACVALALACTLALPALAFAEGGLSDGTYEVPVTLEGGSGRASLEPTADVIVDDGAITATVVFTSSNYDLMVVDGKEFAPETTDPGSTFTIPVASLSDPLAVSAETVAMGDPHMIDYTITFDVSSVVSVSGDATTVPIIAAVIIAIVVVAAIVAVIMVRRRRTSDAQAGGASRDA